MKIQKIFSKKHFKEELSITIFTICAAILGILILIFKPSIGWFTETRVCTLGIMLLTLSVMFIIPLIYKFTVNYKK